MWRTTFARRVHCRMRMCPLFYCYDRSDGKDYSRGRGQVSTNNVPPPPLALIRNLCYSLAQEMSMTRRPTPILKILLIAVCLGALFGSAAPPADLVLVRLDKAEAARIPTDGMAGADVLQELKSAWILALPGPLLAEFTRQGIPCEILDDAPWGKLISSWPRRGRTMRLSWPASGTRSGWMSGPACSGRAPRKPARYCPRISGSGGSFSRTGGPSPWRTSGRRTVPRSFPRSRRRSPPIRGSPSSSPTSKTNLTADIQALQNFQTRYTSTAGCESAGTYLYNYFIGLGLACEYDPFSFSSNRYSSRHIVATIPGRTTPAQDLCPRLLRFVQQPSFILRPRRGRQRRAGRRRSWRSPASWRPGFRLHREAHLFLGRGMGPLWEPALCPDGQEPGREDPRRHQPGHDRLFGYDASQIRDLREFQIRRLSIRYLRPPPRMPPFAVKEVIDASADWSDHYYFWDQGFSAVCGIEEASERNPFYHRTTDTLDRLNLDFAVDATRASLAAAADLAQLVTVNPTIAPPTGLQARSQVVGSLFNGFKTVFLQWDAGPSTIMGFNVYRTKTSGSGYVKINAALLTAPSFVDRFLGPSAAYYYVVAAVDNQGRESAFSAEVRDDASNKTN